MPPRGRRRARRSPVKILLAILVIFFIAAAATQLMGYNLFAIVQPGEDPSTWIKVKGVKLAEAYERKDKIAVINFYYRPVVWVGGESIDGRWKGKWRELGAQDNVASIQYKTKDGTWVTVNKVPGYWSVYLAGAQKGKAQHFRFDPDEEHDGLPDVYVLIHTLEYSMARSPYIPEKARLFPNMTWPDVAKHQYYEICYQVHYGLLATSPNEWFKGYSNSYVELVINPGYKVLGIQLDYGNWLIPGRDIFYDESGGVKLILPIPPTQATYSVPRLLKEEFGLSGKELTTIKHVTIKVFVDKGVFFSFQSTSVGGTSTATQTTQPSVTQTITQTATQTITQPGTTYTFNSIPSKPKNTHTQVIIAW